MSVRFLLQYNKTPSHAVVTCTPWTRWLTETESPSGKGHVVGKEIALRKTTGQFNIITRIEIEQLKGDTTKAQRYLDAAAWWLHRPPFGVERLPVKLIAHRYERSLVSVDGWNVTSLVVGDLVSVDQIPVDSLGPLPVNLKELYLYHIRVSDLTPFRDLEILSVEWCSGVRDLSGLQGCRHLRVLDLSGTKVDDLSVLAGFLSLEELGCRYTGVTTLAPLATCGNLKKLSIEGCTQISDLSSLSGLRFLEDIDMSSSAIPTLAPLATCHNLKKLNLERCTPIPDLSPLSGLRLLEEINMRHADVTTLAALAMCHGLRKVNCGWCQSLTDISALAGAPLLEEIEAWNSGVTTIAGLGTCDKLKKVFFDKCASLHDLMPLAGAPSLEQLWAKESGVTTITGLGTCANLKIVDFAKCALLHDISPLTGAQSLEDLSPLGGAPSLERIHPSQTHTMSTTSPWCVGPVPRCEGGSQESAPILFRVKHRRAGAGSWTRQFGQG